MELIGKLILFCTFCFASTDKNYLSERVKRFILQQDVVTNNAQYPIPTTFPVPKIQTTQSFITGTDLLKSVVVKCPVKRSVTGSRVLLDDQLMQELYLTLLGNIDKSTVAGNLNDAEYNFWHILTSFRNQTIHHHHNNKNYKKSMVHSDLKKYHSWYNSVMSDIREQHHAAHNASLEVANPDNSLESILNKTGLTKSQLKQLLGLVNEIDDIKDLRLSSKRIKRDTIGAVRSQTEYCNQRGVGTGTGFVHMCSSCALTTEFPEDMFPRYVSEVSCDQSDCDCFTIKNTAHGTCKPVIKNMKMLKRKSDGCRLVIKNGQQVLVDNWELYEQPLHVGCECMFKKNSMFAGFIKRH